MISLKRQETKWGSKFIEQMANDLKTTKEAIFYIQQTILKALYQLLKNLK